MPHITQEDFVGIMERRAAEMEPADELTEVVQLEYVLDLFSDDERKHLQKEIDRGKEVSESWKKFRKSLCQFKALTLITIVIDMMQRGNPG